VRPRGGRACGRGAEPLRSVRSGVPTERSGRGRECGREAGERADELAACGLEAGDRAAGKRESVRHAAGRESVLPGGGRFDARGVPAAGVVAGRTCRWSWAGVRVVRLRASALRARAPGSGQSGWISMRYASAARNHRQPHPAIGAIHRILSVRIMPWTRFRTMAIKSYSTVQVLCEAMYACYGKRRRYEDEVEERTSRIVFARRAVDIPMVIVEGGRGGGGASPLPTPPRYRRSRG
jgi:hypothetical protein